MTTSRVQSGDPNAMGPISYLIVEFPGSKMTGRDFRSFRRSAKQRGGGPAAEVVHGRGVPALAAAGSSEEHA